MYFFINSSHPNNAACAYSPNCSVYISNGNDKENLFLKQSRAPLVGNNFFYSHDFTVIL